MAKNVFKIKGTNFTLNDKDFDMWGIRVANALENDRTTFCLLNNMDDYKKHGINTMSVFLMGAWSGSANPFECDGAINAKLRGSHTYNGRGNCEAYNYCNPYLDRLSVIIEEADAKDMVVNVGIFYQMRINQLSGVEAIRNATTNIAYWLKAKGYKNIFMDLVNEYAHIGYKDRDICFGMKNRGSADAGEILIHDFKSILPDIPVSISTCGADVKGVKQRYINFSNQDMFFIHHKIDPEAIRRETGRQLPVVCNEWGPGVALEPTGNLGQWTHKDKEEWEKVFNTIRNGNGKMFIFSHWKQKMSVDGPHFEVGPKGTQPNKERGGEPSDAWLFEMVEKFKSKEYSN